MQFPNTPSLEAESAASEMKMNSAVVENKPSVHPDFEKIKGKVMKLKKDWDSEIDETETRRELRYLSVDVEQERVAGKFKQDEIYIPIRIIDDNIRKEAAQYIAYLTTSRNAAVFKSKDPEGKDLNMNLVEREFTGYVRYNGWEIPYFKVLDGAQTHGWDGVEIAFDKDKPGFFTIEHIAHEHLWYPVDTEHLQDSPIVVRNCRVTREKLEKFKNIKQDQVELLFKDKDNQETCESLITIQKVFYRIDGIVHICWLDCAKSTDFIRDPKPLFLGRRQILVDSISGTAMVGDDIYESQYPIEILPYVVSENGKLKSVKGRVFYDEFVQEAAGSLISSIVNAWHRASQVMGAPKNPSGLTGNSPEVTNTEIIGGKMYNSPIDFFHMPYPDQSGLTIIQALITQNKSETSQVNFAVNNREDSRKTAREISAAASQASLLSGVQVTLFSIFLRNVFTRCWSISQSMIQQGYLLTSLPPDYHSINYELYSAGDTEVVMREEMLARMQMSWSVVANTPAALPFLKDILSLAFPAHSDKYIKALEEANIEKNVIKGLASVVEAALASNPEIVPPQDLPNLQMLLQAAKQTTGGMPVQSQQANGNTPIA